MIETTSVQGKTRGYMSKIAQYLSEHIAGEVLTSADVLEAFSTDASVLRLAPELVVYPRSTNDIRKVTRFTWQLAEKGHRLSITSRGGGSDQTGAAIGDGIVLATMAHLQTIYELDVKQKLIRLQPGVTFQALNQALSLHGLTVPSSPASAAYSTIGGAIANNASGLLSAGYGATNEWVQQLEVVLSNGDILQTERISKRELNRKKGEQTFEGEIYRQIDGLIVDNEQLINDKIATDVRDNAGYAGIAQVRGKDGSIDLTPLFLGSQGTLGVISEVIMRTDFAHLHQAVGVALFEESEVARDVIDELANLDPAYLEFIDGELLQDAVKRGKKFHFYDSKFATGAALLFGFDDFSERQRGHSMKKALKILSARQATVVSAQDDEAAKAILAIRAVSALRLAPDGHGESAPAVIDGAYVPMNRFEDFTAGLDALAKKHHVSLPLYGSALEQVFQVQPILQLQKVGDKQKIFKLLDAYSALVVGHGGHLIGQAGEGRLKAATAYKEMDDDILKLYQQVRAIFDPYTIMNAGVKQANDVKTLAGMLRADNPLASFVQYAPYN